jgi:CelD/BcsL family acetyltransferase involved in cellulose biosynthesis
VPVQPKQYFHLLWHLILEPGLGRLFLAQQGAEPIAGAVILASQRTAIYKYGAWDERARALRPNHLVLWTAIEWALEGGATTFDLGRTDTAQQGLRSFKTGWGAREETLTYSTLGGPAHSVRSSPAFVSYAIRHSPPVVCRALGEAFYRFAA